jgi:DNA-binding NarL/FixJ family response regulator
VVDDHKIVREGLVSLLSEQQGIEVIGEAGNGREAISMASSLHPDVIIMDVSMPLMSGDEATRKIKSLMPDIRIIALSMFEEEEMIQKMRNAGAEKYVLKTAPSAQLLSAIRGSDH